MNSLPIVQTLEDWWYGEQTLYRIWIGVIVALIVLLIVVIIHGVRSDRRKKARKERYLEMETSAKNGSARSGRLSEALDELDRVKVGVAAASRATSPDNRSAAMAYLDDFDIWQETAGDECPARPSAENRPAPSEAKKPAGKETAKPAEKETAKPAEKEPAKSAGKEPAKPAAKEPAKPADKEPVKPAEGAETASGDCQPVISVQNVTMVFHVATSNVSGLKEYVIQAFKKQISHRELLALNNVSFDVFKGEVVGVIGTNGSGKSTLLRIVSGALRPTSGQVVVDHKKVQLLTLGTGFDLELTARENVYLNGAIIGYSREFLDAHYDEIVEFSELEGFMEEKVKNFSSGMVSRLGFSIATAGGAAEILILDEILSVGDEFFRKKSLARIKQMIHGGSTVLMVSHSMPTIMDNCTKVVWIEKGDLKMIGDPKKVCAAYRAMNG